MKKLFSFMLMATALLISGQAKAAVIEVNGSTETLKEAFDRALTGDEIKLTASLNGMGGICRLYDGRDITINLNGNNINVPNDDIFMIYKGHLTITGKGTITFNSSIYGGAKTPHTIDGVTYTGGIPYMFITMYGARDSSTKPGYSWFTLGKDVTLECTKTANDYQYGISISMFGSYSTEYRDALNEELGYVTTKAAGEKNDKAVAYGVLVDVHGKIIATGSCIAINGTIQGKGENVPHINVYETAELVCYSTHKDQDGNAITANGYGIWNIKGYLSGDVGMYAKGGQITLDGAFVESKTIYQAPAENGDGTSGSGSAIVYDTHEAYSGAMVLNVVGSTTVVSEHGYAIEECITKGTVSNTEELNIESGTFIGSSDEGKKALEITPDLGAKVIATQSIKGGTYSSEDIREFLGDNGIIIPVVKGGETVYVIAQNPNKTQDDDGWVSTIAEAVATDYVKIAADETIAADKEIAYLSIPGANKVTVKSGAKLSVGEAVLGENAVIEVEAGARLVVNGTNGLIAFETTNLVLKAAAGQPTGMFVLNPDVKANKQPWATLEYVSKAYTLGSNEYMWEMFTNPFATILTASRDPNQPSIFQHVVNGQFENFAAWGTDGDVRSAKPFELIAVTNTSNQTTDVKYTFTGQLQGSNDAAFSLNAGFNYLGNGYTALMNAKQVIAALQQSSENVRTLLYVWIFGDQRWKIYNGYKLNELNDVNPLTAFVLYADEAAEVNMDYEKLIWNANK